MVSLNISNVHTTFQKKIFSASVRSDISLWGNKNWNSSCGQIQNVSNSVCTPLHATAHHCTHRIIRSVFHTPHLGNPWDASVRVASVPSHQNRTLVWVRSDKRIPRPPASIVPWRVEAGKSITEVVGWTILSYAKCGLRQGCTDYDTTVTSYWREFSCPHNTHIKALNSLKWRKVDKSCQKIQNHEKIYKVHTAAWGNCCHEKSDGINLVNKIIYLLSLTQQYISCINFHKY
jgi:hypothetical protein